MRLIQDVHTFGYLARSNYPANVKNISDTVVNLGWTAEGRNGEQLPEQLLAGLTLIKVNPKNSYNVTTLNKLLEEHHVESSIDPFKIRPEEWLKRGLHLDD